MSVGEVGPRCTESAPKPHPWALQDIGCGKGVGSGASSLGLPGAWQAMSVGWHSVFAAHTPAFWEGGRLAEQEQGTGTRGPCQRSNWDPGRSPAPVAALAGLAQTLSTDRTQVQLPGEEACRPGQ